MEMIERSNKLNKWTIHNCLYDIFGNFHINEPLHYFQILFYYAVGNAHRIFTILE